MQLGTLTWSYNEGEGTARTNAEFKEAHAVTRLDALQDWIFDLTELYNTELAAFNRTPTPPPHTEG